MTSDRWRRRARLAGATPIVMALALSAAACTSVPPKASGGPGPRSSATVAKGGATTSPTTTAPPPPLAWSACGGSFQCATLPVPLEETKAPGPENPTVGLALIRLPATDPAARIGSLLVNPGGPGVSGVSFLRQASGLFSARLRRYFDIVSFDPPGVGASDPVRCESPAGLARFIDVDPAPQTASGVQEIVAASKSFAAGCKAMSGDALLANVGTVSAARAMDRIRAALGDKKLTYLGFSYGTFLGATYASLFPHKVRAMALDGAIDPALGTQQEDLQQALGFEQDLKDFENYCDALSSCPLHGPGGAAGAVRAVLTRVHQQPPLPGPPGSGRVLSAGEAYLGLAWALYSSSYWSELASALAEAENGSGAALLAMSDQYTERNSDGTYSNAIEANTAISCMDRPVPTALSTYESDAKSFAAQAPVFGELEAYAPLPCAYWPVPTTGRPGPITAAGSPPIVVVGTTGDPATPYSWAQALARQLAHGVLVTHVGVGHTAYGDSSCVRAAVDAYLVQLQVPAQGLRCTS